MSVLPQLERDLIEAAARQRRSTPSDSAQTAGSSDARHGLRRLRMPLIVVGCLLASATIALAAEGVLPVGASVKPREPLNPNAGAGMPLPGGSRLLALRAPDPYGGPPWGMRVIRTTRGEVCVQIGRVQNGQLGELGIDGAFHDDGRFHPIPADAQADYSLGGGGKAGFAPIGGCQLAGSAEISREIGDDRNAGVGLAKAAPVEDRRNIYWGLLGPQAVSVTLGADPVGRTVSVLPELGAYLIVTRTTDPSKSSSGEGSIGTPGKLAAGAGLSAIAYRIDGRLCERGISDPFHKTQLAHPCPQPHWPTHARSRAIPDLHLPVHARLEIYHHLVTGVVVSFHAPYAVTSARHYYMAQMPAGPCRASSRLVEGYSGQTLDRDVAQGTSVSFNLGDPFAITPRCHPSSSTIRIVYAAANGGGSTIVGTVEARLPTGARPAPLPHGPLRHRARRRSHGRPGSKR